MRRAGQIAGGLKVLNGTDICTGGHTRVGEDGTETTIDFVMVSSALMPHVVGMSVLKDRMGSDHRLIVLKLRGLVNVARAETKPREVWRMENIPHYKSKEQYENMVSAFQEAFREWHASVKAHLASPAGVDARPGDMCEVLEKSFQTQLDDVALEQIGRKLIGPASTPIMSAAVKRLNERRQECERETRRAGLTDEERSKAVEAYRRAKGDLLSAVAARREELELEIFKQIEAKQADSKLFWAKNKTVLGGLTNSVSPPPMAINDEGDVETDPLSVLRVWRSFSSGIANPGPSEECIYDEDHKSVVESELDFLRKALLHQPELDGVITRQEVFSAIRKLKSGKAPGVDGVTTTILKMAADAVGTSKLKGFNPVVDSLVLLFNYVFANEVWPERWATGIIFPLYKEGSRLEPGNYRPIALLSVIGKLFGSVVESRLSSWSERHLALADEQGGFRRARGTPDLIFMLREIILTRTARGQATFTTFIDARKAYDTVWREGNYVRLHDMGVKGKLWRQVQAMSKDPKSKIRLPFGETDYFKVSRGVAQGAVESPFLYACFINGLAEELKGKGFGVQIAGKLTPLLMYADDVVFLAGSIEELRQMNDVVTGYARRNRYRLNGDKSAVMAFNVDPATKEAVASEPWRLSGEVVKVKDKYKYLGVDVLTNVKDWTPYFNRAIAKAKRVSADLEWACRRDGGLRPRSAATLWKAIVRPVLEYTAEIWAGDISGPLAARAEAVQTNFARTILGLVGCQSISNDVLRAEMGMEKLSARWEKLRLGYWRRLNVASADRTLSALASLRRKHVIWDQKGSKDGWMGSTRSLLKKHGMLSHWFDPSLCVDQCKDEWKDIVYEAVESKEGEVLRQRLSSMSGEAVARYARIKHWGTVTEEFAAFAGEVGRRGALVPEPYLDDRSESVGRRLKLMCRLGCLPTMDRVAREEKLPPSEGRCRLCAEGEVEDLQHLLLSCPAHNRPRAKMVAHVERTLGDAVGVTFDKLSPADQTDLLLGKSTGDARTDTRVNACVTRYLKKAWRGRKHLTSALNKTLGREDTVWALRAHGDGECRIEPPRLARSA
jgi:hypothetical protein